LQQQQFEQLKKIIYDLTPPLVHDLHVSMQNEPEVAKRYKVDEMQAMAEEGVISFRDVLLAGLQIDAPSIVASRLDWLDHLLKSRHITADRVHIFLNLVRKRLQIDTNVKETAPILDLLDNIEAKLK
jgi:hypothetical protein